VTEQFRFGLAMAQPAQYRLDEIDRQIITLLLRDGRMSGAAVARFVGVSQRTAGYRIEKLTHSGVIQIGAVVNPHVVGLDAIADVFLEVAPGQVREVAEAFAQLEEVSYVAGSIGNGDLSIQVCLRDSNELTRFVNEVVAKVPGVTRARTVLVPWKLKDVYQWNVPPAFDDVVQAYQDVDAPRTLRPKTPQAARNPSTMRPSKASGPSGVGQRWLRCSWDAPARSQRTAG
jgi:Lrp/AsnC family transcriptional regulator for asnA, asnC and gidA